MSGAAIGTLVVVLVAQGKSPLRLFGAYAEAIRAAGLVDLPLGTVRHLGALAIYTAVVPLIGLGVVHHRGWVRAATGRSESSLRLACRWFSACASR